MNECVPYTAISIYVVGSKLQGYGTRPKGGMGRLEFVLGHDRTEKRVDCKYLPLSHTKP